MLDAPTPWEIYHANCRALERRAAAFDRPTLHHPRELSLVSNPSSLGRKIEKSFSTFVGGCEALRDKRFEDRGESDNLQPDEGGHSLEVKHRSRPWCEM